VGVLAGEEAGQEAEEAWAHAESYRSLVPPPRIALLTRLPARPTPRHTPKTPRWTADKPLR
jgi:hypothetical protein